MKMSQKRSASRDDSGRNTEDPPMSRLFVICSKENTEDEIRSNFEKFGPIEDIWVVKDKRSGENKGVVYIKFNKTSDAARALEDMNGKTLTNSTRPIKVLVANSRNQGSRRSYDEEEKYLRLFVLIPKDMSENELTDIFGKFGVIDSVTIIRDKSTKEGKGFGYVKYTKFSDAAIAFEMCDPKYKAVFAEPKPRNNSNSNNDSHSNNTQRDIGRNFNSSFNDFSPNFSNMSMNNRSGSDRRMSFGDMGMSGLPSGIGGTEATLYVACSPLVNQDQLWRLFDIIPGLDFCRITGECRDGRNVLYGTVVYNNQQSAAYARDKLHGLEYPPGERLIVKAGVDLKFQGNVNPDSLFMGCNSNVDNVNENFCSVPLPPPQPMADENASCAQRCFIVCVSQTIPTNVLRNVFSRFGGLIDIYLLPNKNCGYAKYASEISCKRAIDTLHGAEICGTRIKVMEAEELGNDERRKRQRRDD